MIFELDRDGVSASSQRSGRLVTRGPAHTHFATSRFRFRFLPALCIYVRKASQQRGSAFKMQIFVKTRKYLVPPSQALRRRRRLDRLPFRRRHRNRNRHTGHRS
jgi:hypothetical protein